MEGEPSAGGVDMTWDFHGYGVMELDRYLGCMGKGFIRCI